MASASAARQAELTARQAAERAHRTASQAQDKVAKLLTEGASPQAIEQAERSVQDAEFTAHQADQKLNLARTERGRAESQERKAEAARGAAVKVPLTPSAAEVRAGQSPLGLPSAGSVWHAAARGPGRGGVGAGGDLPGWFAELFGNALLPQIADRRGEVIHAACTHWKRCTIEHVIRRAREADIVIANHALVMAQAVWGGLDDSAVPTRYVFDEGHHLFDAADSAF